MAIDATSASSASQTNGIGMQQFLKILTSQLSNQDPLKPLDNQEFIAQMAQFSALEQSRELNLKIDQLFALQATNQSVGLLGKTVDVNSTGGTTTGKITAINLSSGEPQFTVTTTGGAFLPGVVLSQIVNIR